MDLLSLLPPESRVIDVGATDADLARTLAAAGQTRYLALVPPQRLERARAGADGLGERFWPLTDPDQPLHASCDLLILRASFARLLWAVRDLRGVSIVAVERPPAPLTPLSVETQGARFVSRLGGWATRVGQWAADGVRFDVLQLPPRHEQRPRPRHYLSPAVGIEGFVERLGSEGVRYAALRWFETLPEIGPGEDLDLLVADDDLATVHRILGEEPGTIPVDVYSETGLDGADFQNAAYYPPQLARLILDRAVVHGSGALVPSPVDHLHSMAYHAVYHKGSRSGLPSTDSGRLLPFDAQDEAPEHDYPTVLGDLARAVGVTLPQTLEEIDGYLATVGWRPPVDTLRRLAAVNPWVRAHAASEAADAQDTAEISVFFVRERALTVVDLDDISAVLDHFGFEVLATRELDEDARSRCAREARGGNWGRGPFPESGGGPAAVMVALHHAPQAVIGSVKVQYPHLSNAEVYFAKRRIREVVDALVPADARFNAVHSSDDVVDAWHYVELALPAEVEALRAEVERRENAFQTTGPVIAELSRGRRARVQVIQGSQGAVVRKTYAEGFRRFLDREVATLRELGPLVEAVPELVEAGPNWFSCPLYENALPPMGPVPDGRLVPVPILRQMVAVLRRIHELGYDLVDAKPQNFVLDPRHGLKIVDFEFAYRYADGQAPPFARSYNFVGPPLDFPGDVPVGPTTYERRWLGFAGLPLDVLVDGSPWSQHLHRALFRAERLLTGPRAPARRGVRLARRTLHGARAGVGRQFAAWARRRAQVATP
ncbi:MAG TPA: hypothetical protein VFW79_10330 [Cellulomonas sp.]|uniref:hypothetical protein n=1 Tax=Cellulomonas sp. TaxID=40001 RepID=UPI002E31183F|nr:hypothetical protein [Cellulomonas sp.]HEX5333028.1 hypothetical protein [Cellulomonas sp.]